MIHEYSSGPAENKAFRLFVANMRIIFVAVAASAITLIHEAKSFSTQAGLARYETFLKSPAGSGSCLSKPRHLSKFLAAADDEETKMKDASQDPLTFSENAEGLAKYLGPYVLAFVASIAVTAAFFKYVLLDY